MANDATIEQQHPDNFDRDSDYEDTQFIINQANWSQGGKEK